MIRLLIFAFAFLPNLMKTYKNVYMSLVLQAQMLILLRVDKCD